VAIRESTPTFVAMRVNTHMCGDSQGKTRVCKSIQKEEKEEKEGKAEGACSGSSNALLKRACGAKNRMGATAPAFALTPAEPQYEPTRPPRCA